MMGLQVLPDVTAKLQVKLHVSVRNQTPCYCNLITAVTICEKCPISMPTIDQPALLPSAHSNWQQ